jgi:hypothetical protein
MAQCKKDQRTQAQSASVNAQQKTPRVGEESASSREPRWGSPCFDPQTRLLLRVAGTHHVIEIDLKTGGGVLGRADKDQTPEIDLTQYSDMQLGVSRQHARLDRRERLLYITDLGSVNGTSLNGRRLVAGRSYILRDGDIVHLGLMKLYVSFAPITRGLATSSVE